VIVRHAGDALLLITQPDHAHLAGVIMGHSVALAAHPRRRSILLAVAEHDNGWTEQDAAPHVDPSSGVPLDFISEAITVRQGVWPRGVARLAHDPWAAALVAQHALSIFARYRGDDAWTSLFDGMEARRQSFLRDSGGSLDDLVADYTFVGLGDVISLTFCNGWTDVQRFDEWSVQLSGTQVIVGPDVFGGVTHPISVSAKEIRRRVFESDAELRDELRAARVTSVTGVVG
jgi:hypothetical protein